MSSMPWFRLYTEIIDDPKTGTLSDSAFRTYIELLCLARKHGDDGETGMTAEEIDWKLRRNVSVTLQELLDRDLVTITDNKTISIPAFMERQKKSDSSTDRVRKHRENKKKTQCNDNVTLQERPESKKENKKENKKDTCPEPAKAVAAPPSPPVIELPTNRFNTLNEQAPITQNQIIEWQQTYQAVDVTQALREMRAWLIANPGKRKTKNGMTAFVNRWLAKEQNSVKNPPPRTPGGGGNTKSRPLAADVLDRSWAAQ